MLFLASPMACGISQARDQILASGSLSHSSDKAGSLTCWATRELCSSHIFFKYKKETGSFLLYQLTDTSKTLSFQCALIIKIMIFHLFLMDPQRKLFFSFKIKKKKRFLFSHLLSKSFIYSSKFLSKARQ